jgi:hypothetical protein
VKREKELELVRRKEQEELDKQQSEVSQLMLVKKISLGKLQKELELEQTPTL